MLFYRYDSLLKIYGREILMQDFLSLFEVNYHTEMDSELQPNNGYSYESLLFWYVISWKYYFMNISAEPITIIHKILRNQRPWFTVNVSWNISKLIINSVTN
jgi:hypothetical protein